MIVTGSTVVSMSHIVYQRNFFGRCIVFKDRFNDAPSNVTEAMDMHEYRVAIVGNGNKVIRVNKVLQILLESNGYDVPWEITMEGRR